MSLSAGSSSRPVVIQAAFGLIVLLAWTAPLFLLHIAPESLIAHDEGLYASRGRLMLDTGDFIHPFSEPHHKPPGYYWLLGGIFRLFGYSETAARIPTGLMATLIVWLTFAIGREIMPGRAAALAAAILAICPFFFFASRLVSPDLYFVSLSLLSIYALLRARRTDAGKTAWCFVAGFAIGFISLMRGPALFLPLLAVLPFLVSELRRGNLRAAPLAIGFVLGLVPVAVWLYLCWLRLGDAIFMSLYGFSAELAVTERSDNGPEFYFWNLAVHAFPWIFFALCGLVIALRDRSAGERRLLVAYPAIAFVGLTLFTTRLPHYSLSLYPFIALLAGLVLARIAGNDRRFSWIGLVTLAFGIVVLAALPFAQAEFERFVGLQKAPVLAACVTVVGLAIALGGLLDRFRPSMRLLDLPFIGPLRIWLVGIMAGMWLGFVVAAATGIIGDTSAVLRRFLASADVSAAIGSQTVDIAVVPTKSMTLLSFMTPHVGRIDIPWQELVSNGGLAWVATADLDAIARSGVVLARLDSYGIALVRWTAPG